MKRKDITYIECRTWGHQWDTFAPLQRERGYGTQISLRCTRCACERFDWIDSSGALNSRQYNYPDGYKMAKNDRPSLGDLRLELLHRLRRSNGS
jgi:hypothetical protein